MYKVVRILGKKFIGTYTYICIEEKLIKKKEVMDWKEN